MEGDKVSKGKMSRRKGAEFERKVRAVLEGGGWVVARWQNTVEMVKMVRKITPAKVRYNPYGRALCYTTGFPDFVAFRRNTDSTRAIVGIECKVRGVLDKREREMVGYYLESGVFDTVMVAFRRDDRGVGFYDYEKKSEKKRDLLLLRGNK